MQKILTWCYNSIKLCLSNRLFYIISAAMIFLCLIVANIDTKSKSDYIGIVFKQDTSVNDKLVEYLSKDRNVTIFENTDSLKNEILKQTISIGFVVKTSPEEYVSDLYSRGKVELYAPVGYLYTEVEKERFYEAWLFCCSDILNDAEAENIFAKADDDLKEQIKEGKEAYLNSDRLFDVNIKYNHIDESAGTKSSNHDLYIRLIIALTVFIYAFTAYGQICENTMYGVVTKSLKTFEKTGYGITRNIMFSLLIGFIGVTCDVFILHTNILSAICNMLLYILVVNIFCFILGKFLKDERSYIVSTPILILIQILICPAFFDASAYFVPIRYVRYLFPVYYYLIT